MTHRIQHDSEQKKFSIKEETHEAFLKYSEKPGNVLDFKETFVPEAFRGQGVAAELVKAGLAHARENNFTVIPTCSYVDTYIKRHATDFGDLVAKDGGIELNVCEKAPEWAEHARLDDDNEPCDDGRSGNI